MKVFCSRNSCTAKKNQPSKKIHISKHSRCFPAEYVCPMQRKNLFCQTKSHIQKTGEWENADTTKMGLEYFPDFITQEQEKMLWEEATQALGHRKYEVSHWDKVITGYREILKSR